MHQVNTYACCRCYVLSPGENNAYYVERGIILFNDRSFQESEVVETIYSSLLSLLLRFLVGTARPSVCCLESTGALGKGGRVSARVRVRR